MLPLKRTLGDMRSELQTRLGFGMSGQAGIVNSPIMDSFLRSAQEQLYWQFEWADLKSFEERLTGSEQQFYDYPERCNVERITSVALWDGGQLCQLEEGISPEQRSTLYSGQPTRFERAAQMELWPVPNSQFRMRREFVRTLGRFTESDDRASLPDELVFLMALSDAKAHYRQPDAQAYGKRLDALLVKLKAKHRGQSVWDGRSRRMSKDEFYAYPRV